MVNIGIESFKVNFRNIARKRLNVMEFQFRKLIFLSFYIKFLFFEEPYIFFAPYRFFLRYINSF